MYNTYDLNICDIVNEYCFNWIDSSTAARQKNKTKTGSSKQRLQYTDIQLCDANDAVKNGMVVYTASRTFGIPYQTLCDKISGRTLTKIKHRRVFSLRYILLKFLSFWEETLNI